MLQRLLLLIFHGIGQDRTLATATAAATAATVASIRPDADTISYLRTREYCAATVAITAAALDILRAQDRPDWTKGPVRSLAFATAAAAAHIVLYVLTLPLRSLSLLAIMRE